MYEHLLKGVVDLHIHAGPSAAEREVDVAEMLKQAETAGYAAFVVKDHYFPTMLSAATAEKHVGNGSCEVFGGLCLNNSVGGFNLKAIDMAYLMGAKFICMPTLSAKRHIDSHRGRKFAGSSMKAAGIEEEPIYYLDEAGSLKPEVERVLEFMAARPELVLYTGHGSAEEVDALVRRAREIGVENILVNHPFMTVGASVEQMVEWSRLGAFIEINASAFPKFIPVEVLGPILSEVPMEKLVIDTDSGQKGGGSPVDVLRRLIGILQDTYHVDGAKLSVMMRDNPRALIGL